MALDPVNTLVLVEELKDLTEPKQYQGLTADQAYAKLFVGIVSNSNVPNGFKLNPVSCAKLIGIVKTETIATVMKQQFPVTSDHLMNTGLDALATETQAFLVGMVGAKVITQEDLDIINAASVNVVQIKVNPTHDIRFAHPNISELRKNSGAASPSPSVAGFPNIVDQNDFNACWIKAGRK